MPAIRLNHGVHPVPGSQGANSEMVRDSMNVVKPAVAFKFLTREAIDGSTHICERINDVHSSASRNNGRQRCCMGRTGGDRCAVSSSGRTTEPRKATAHANSLGCGYDG